MPSSNLSPVTRRGFLSRAAVGTVAAWTLPEIITTAPVAAATGSGCDTFSVTATRPLATGGWGNQLVTGVNSIDRVCITPTNLVSRTAQMIGLNSDPGTDASYTSIDYAAYFYHRDGNRRVYIYENGTYRGVWQPIAVGDQVCIERDLTGTVRYLLNGAVIYTSPTTSTADLCVDSSFHSANGGPWSSGTSSFTVAEC